jgi:transcription elongation factor GreA
VGRNEANPREGKISHESPIGKALLGHRVGDVVEANLPNGNTVKLEILNIE